MQRYDVIIVGAGHGGAQTAIALRQKGFEGSIAMVGEEAAIPYERPPLSKEYLSGEKPFERILIRPETFWPEKKIDMIVGLGVTTVDPEAGTVGLANGDALAYGSLVWAAGGHARKLSCPGGNLGGVHSVRNRADVDRIMVELPSAENIVVIGGGYIGLEAAAVLTKLGKRVVVIEALDRVLSRVAGQTLSRFFENEHLSHGVDLQFGEQVECLVGVNRVRAVRLASGEDISADLVIVGIGIVPAVEPLLAAGATGPNGVAVDEFCRTNLPNVYAIGDCALHANAFAGGMPLRLESVQNATDMALTAVRSIMGSPEPYDAVPWFWSNQYDLKLQTVGLSIGHDREVVRGNPASRSFSVVYLKEGHVIALDCVNAVRDYVQGKALVQTRAEIAEDQLALAEVPLKAIFSG